VPGGRPGLVAAGPPDPLIPPEVGEALADASPNGRAEILEGCGHIPNLERPDAFNRILATFLDSP
jgi:pimeloyl-ACP methyl ester carboxylesterase